MRLSITITPSELEQKVQETNEKINELKQKNAELDDPESVEARLNTIEANQLEIQQALMFILALLQKEK